MKPNHIIQMPRTELPESSSVWSNKAVLALKAEHAARSVFGLFSDATYDERILKAYAKGSISLADIYNHFTTRTVALNTLLNKCLHQESCGLSEEEIQVIVEKYRKDAQNTVMHQIENPRTREIVRAFCEEQHAQDKKRWRDHIQKIFSQEALQRIEEKTRSKEGERLLSGDILEQFAIYTNPDIFPCEARSLRDQLIMNLLESSPEVRFDCMQKFKELADQFQKEELQDRIHKFEDYWKQYLIDHASELEHRKCLTMELELYLHSKQEYALEMIEQLVERCAHKGSLGACIAYAQQLIQYDPTIADHCNTFIQKAEVRKKEEMKRWSDGASLHFLSIDRLQNFSLYTAS